jgi:hypothetical protein
VPGWALGLGAALVFMLGVHLVRSSRRFRPSSS